MRLRRLELTRYGKFTDYTIDFGEKNTGASDLHVVYGPNEAGKSTALSGFLDLLFGIEARSKFNFLHAYAVMRIGAILEFGGQAQSFCRIKRPQNSLLDGNDQVIAEHAILAQLGGIQREQFRAMFSLDDETLEKGGEGILASQGRLGELLFSGSSGLGDLSPILEGLRGDADKFYRLHARSGELADHKARIATLRQEREKLDTTAAEYARRIEARDRAKQLYEEALAERGAIRSRMDAVQRFVGALPRLNTLRTLRDKIDPLADLPEAPAGWAASMPGLQAEATALSVRQQAVEVELGQLEGAVASIAVDEGALQIGERTDGWLDPRARAVTAGKDIPDRQVEVRNEDIAIAGILGRLGRAGHADPRELIVAAPLLGRLRELLENRSGVEAAQHASARELGEARDALAEAQASQDTLRGGLVRTGDDRLDEIAIAVQALQADDHAARARLATRARASRLDEATEQLLGLLPWRGDADELAALPVPDPEQLQSWRTALAEAQKRLDRHENEVARLLAERIKLVAEYDSIAKMSGVVSDQQAASIRAQRETAWAMHRSALDLATADAFEHVLRQDDIVTSTRSRHEADIATLHRVGKDLAVVQAAETNTLAARDTAREAADNIHAAIATAIGTTAPSLPTGMTLTQLETWLGKRDRVLETRNALKQAEADLRDAQIDGEAVRSLLAGALAACDIPHDPASSSEKLLAVAQSALAHRAEAKAVATQMQQHERDVRRRERALAKAQAADEAWAIAWSEACGACWIGSIGSTPTPSAVREIITGLAELGPTLDRRALLLDRIEKMQQDQVSFAAEVTAAARALGVPVEGIAPLDLDRTISRLVQHARAARDRKASKLDELAAARRRQNDLREAAEIHRRRAADMAAYFGVETLPEVDSRLRDSERRNDLRRQAAEAERDILDGLRVASMEAAESLLEQADRTALEVELADLHRKFDDQDGRAQDLFAAYCKAKDLLEAVGGDDSVARIEEQRRTILLEIEDGARRYLRLRAGIAAAEHALRAYRQQHRSSMMTHASEAFRIISRNAYSGLAGQPRRDNEVLVAIAADGGSKIASELSKGTRFQLYLALRVAGYHELARLHDPVPFIADDIMETFDDFRAEEAFRLFADMAQVGQVIYMTHHQHLCDIARRVCPDVRVHELAA